MCFFEPQQRAAAICLRPIQQAQLGGGALPNTGAAPPNELSAVCWPSAPKPETDPADGWPNAPRPPDCANPVAPGAGLLLRPQLELCVPVVV
ncbi:hypothetical protein T492DRAFT_881955 [Pavlovales sp. CCMP2436]|nr:hypothetical protein T492DRAFT_881955 [Pavlovales sp. CCMP2436]